MSRNDARDFAQRLYARIPAHYRVYDAERGQPLLALLLVVGEQVANIRQDLDALWDNFFIETCDDWVVPYIGALVGANLLQQPVGQSNRLDVWNTVLWRRSKGTPQMLQRLAADISGWPLDLAEFFQSLGWSQNMNHVRLDRPLMPDVRDDSRFRLLGHAADPFAHAADFKPSRAMEQARVTAPTHSLGISAFGTPGRYQIKNLGFFVRRLRTFPVRGATPAAALPGAAATPNSSLFAFHPLFRDTPLFELDSAAPVSRAAFAANPAQFFGGQASIAVRQFGVLLAGTSSPQAPALPAEAPFTFGGASSVSLDAGGGMRLMHPAAFQLGSLNFVIVTQWLHGGATTALGTLSTLAAAANKPAFTLGSAAAAAGQLAVTIHTASGSPSGRFPGAVLAIRASRPGPLHTSDALYVYLPPALVKTNQPVQYLVSSDGSTHSGSKPARAAEGQIFPSRVATNSTTPASALTALSRGPQGMVLPDPARFGGAGVFIQADLGTGPGTFQPLGAIATVDRPASDFSGFRVAPGTWPAFTYAPSLAALQGTGPSQGIFSILIRPLTGDFIPACELVVANRAGASLLVYLPEQSGVAAAGVRVLVADDGSTWFAPSSPQTVTSFDSLVPARASFGQVLPIPGVWPIQHRIPVAANLCRSERTALLVPGELGIDPDLGRFGLPPGDPAIAPGSFTVDYVEAFSDAIGANSERQVASTAPATRLVSRSGDADSALTETLNGAPIHTSLAAAIAAARDGDVIEIVDSGTYPAPSGITLNGALQNLTIRAATGQRPCFTFYTASNVPAPSSLVVTTPLDSLSLDGLLMSGGPLRIQSPVGKLNLVSCTLDPKAASSASLIGASDGQWVLSRCISGGIQIGPGQVQLTAADSILDQKGGSAVAGVYIAQLERITVLGAILCAVLQASECLFDDPVIVQDQQSGCVRFSRYERGSVLPRRYQCIPSESQLAACAKKKRCLAPVFNSREFGRPGYAQLGFTCAQTILRASEAGAEVGAFASTLNTIRLRNLTAKLNEFMPVGLSAVVVAET